MVRCYGGNKASRSRRDLQLTIVFLYCCRMPTRRALSIPPSSRETDNNADNSVRRISRERVQTEKGSAYRDALKTALRASEKSQLLSGRERQKSPQPGTSGINRASGRSGNGNLSSHDRSTRQQNDTDDSGHSDGDEEEGDDDDDISTMLARAQAAMSVISKVAGKLKNKSTKPRSKSGAPLAKNKSATPAVRFHAQGNQKSQNVISNTGFQRVPLFPDIEIEDGEITEEQDDNDDVVVQPIGKGDGHKSRAHVCENRELDMDVCTRERTNSRVQAAHLQNVGERELSNNSKRARTRQHEDMPPRAIMDAIHYTRVG